MGKFTVTVLLLTALAVPVVLFWQLSSQMQSSTLVAAVIAVVAGWILNVIWAFASRKAVTQRAPQADGGTLKIAAAFGWVCPLVLVALTWLALRFFMGSVA